MYLQKWWRMFFRKIYFWWSNRLRHCLIDALYFTLYSFIFYKNEEISYLDSWRCYKMNSKHPVNVLLSWFYIACFVSRNSRDSAAADDIVSLEIESETRNFAKETMTQLPLGLEKILFDCHLRRCNKAPISVNHRHRNTCLE